MNRRKFIKATAGMIGAGLWVPKAFALPNYLPVVLATYANPDIAWWKFDEGSGVTTADATGNGYTGTLNFTPTWVIGQNGNYAISFNGTTQYVQTSLMNMDFASGSGTITWWVNPTDAYNSSTARVMWGQSIAGNIDFSAQVFTDNNFYVGWDSPGSDSRVILAASSSNWVAGTWQHFAFTWSASGSALYRNGISIGTNSTAPVLSNMVSGFYIAKQGFAQNSYIRGTMDDVRVYSTVLTAAQIGVIFAMGTF